jgi:alpha-ribazole phosphatase
MIVQLIRHGMTKGNESKKYIGKTDEPLGEIGKRALLSAEHQSCDRLYVSPMLRCRQTAQVLFDGMEMTEVPELREIDFGAFEGKNYIELNGDEAYQQWIDSGGTLPFPDGESLEAFKERCVRAFLEVMTAEEARDSKAKIAFVIHGGTIMALMERFCIPKKEYYEYMCKNLGGYICNWDAKQQQLMIVKEEIAKEEEKE